MLISDWSSDVCSSDLVAHHRRGWWDGSRPGARPDPRRGPRADGAAGPPGPRHRRRHRAARAARRGARLRGHGRGDHQGVARPRPPDARAGPRAAAALPTGPARFGRPRDLAGRRGQRSDVSSWGDDRRSEDARRVHPVVERLSSYGWRIIVLVAVLLGALWLLRQLWVVVLALVVATFISRAVDAPVRWLRDKGAPPALAEIGRAHV